MLPLNRSTCLLHNGIPCDRYCCLHCYGYAPPHDIGCSTTRGTGRSRLESPSRRRSPGPAGFASFQGGLRHATMCSTNRHTIPRRCRTCCTARSHWRKTHPQVRFQEIRPHRYRCPETAPAIYCSDDGLPASNHYPTETWLVASLLEQPAPI